MGNTVHNICITFNWTIKIVNKYWLETATKKNRFISNVMKYIDDTHINKKSVLPFHVISTMIHFYYDNEEAHGIQTSIITSIPKEANNILYVSCFPKGLKTYCITFISLMPKFFFVHNMKKMQILEHSSPFVV